MGRCCKTKGKAQQKKKGTAIKMNIKHFIITIAGAVGGAISSAFGGWSAAMTTLCIFMGIDFVSGIVLAGLFHNSSKTDSGALSSKAGFKGIAKKCMILLFVLIGARIDLTLGLNYVKDAVCIAFIINELISIVENAGLMGVPVPKAITKAIDMLKELENDDRRSESDNLKNEKNGSHEDGSSNEQGEDKLP